MLADKGIIKRKVRSVGPQESDEVINSSTLPETNNIAPENGQLEDEPFLFK